MHIYFLDQCFSLEHTSLRHGQVSASTPPSPLIFLDYLPIHLVWPWQSAPSPFDVCCHLAAINLRACAYLLFLLFIFVFHALSPFSYYFCSHMCDGISPIFFKKNTWHSLMLLANYRYKFFWRPRTCVIFVFYTQTRDGVWFVLQRPKQFVPCGLWYGRSWVINA